MNTESRSEVAWSGGSYFKGLVAEGWEIPGSTSNTQCISSPSHLTLPSQSSVASMGPPRAAAPALPQQHQHQQSVAFTRGGVFTAPGPLVFLSGKLKNAQLIHPSPWSPWWFCDPLPHPGVWVTFPPSHLHEPLGSAQSSQHQQPSPLTACQATCQSTHTSHSWDMTPTWSFPSGHLVVLPLSFHARLLLFKRGNSPLVKPAS